jgi:uncharacterized protein
VKLAVEEPGSHALIEAIRPLRPHLTSVIGELETARVCRRAGVPSEQVEQIRAGLVVLALDDEVLRVAVTVEPPTLRTLDAVHLATAVSLGSDLDALITYDARLTTAARDAGLPVQAPV